PDHRWSAGRPGQLRGALARASRDRRGRRRTVALSHHHRGRGRHAAGRRGDPAPPPEPTAKGEIVAVGEATAVPEADLVIAAALHRSKPAQVPGRRALTSPLPGMTDAAGSAMSEGRSRDAT